MGRARREQVDGRATSDKRRFNPLYLEGVPLADGSGGLAGQNRAAGFMPQREEHFRLFVNSIIDYALILLDVDGTILTWGPGAERIEGYRAKDIIGKNFGVFYRREDMKQGKPQRLLQEAEANGRVEDEGWCLREDGSRFWANVVINALRDGAGQLLGYGQLVRDDTTRRRSEEALRNLNEKLDQRVQERTSQLAQANRELQDSLDQLHALAARIQAVREEERANIAREIHDELGQALTALKMDVVWLVRKLPESESPERAKIISMLKLIDGTIQAVRRIAAELRPGMLDDLGLAAAIEWQTQEFQARTGVECQVLLPEEVLVLDEERSTAVFRIFQETLTNVARHAEASRVIVSLERTPQEFVLNVTDNGKSFEAATVFGSKSLGFLGMKERALILGGSLEVHGNLGKGTTVTVRVPWGERVGREVRKGTPKRRKTDYSSIHVSKPAEGSLES